MGVLCFKEQSGMSVLGMDFTTLAAKAYSAYTHFLFDDLVTIEVVPGSVMRRFRDTVQQSDFFDGEKGTSEYFTSVSCSLQVYSRAYFNDLVKRCSLKLHCVFYGMEDCDSSDPERNFYIHNLAESLTIRLFGENCDTQAFRIESPFLDLYKDAKGQFYLPILGNKTYI